MRLMTMIVRGFLPLCLFSAYPAHAQPAEVLALPQEVPLHPITSNAVGHGDPCALEVRVAGPNEITDASFQVDTGSTRTVLSKVLEHALGRRLGTTRLLWTFNQSGSPSEMANEYAAPKLYLRDVQLKTGATVLTSAAGVKASGCDAILGIDCLKHYCIQLDFAAGKLRFLDAGGLKKDGLGRAFALNYVGRMPVVSMNVFDGRTLRLVLDTGFYQPAAGTLPPAVISSAITSRAAKDIGGGIFSFETIDIGGERYKALAFVETQVEGAGVDGFLGLPFLARHLVTLDFPNETVYLKRLISADDSQSRAVPEPSPNAPGGANGKQPFRSETNASPWAASSRGSP